MVFFRIRLLFSAVFVILSIYKTKPIDLYFYFTLIICRFQTFLACLLFVL